MEGAADGAASDRPLTPDWIAGDAHHPFRRYTFRIEHWPRTPRPQPYKEAIIRAVTAGGEHKAATMAAARLYLLHGDVVIYTVELTQTEETYEIDPANDALDYWEVS